MTGSNDALRRLIEVADELCDAVDNAEQDIGGSRPMREIFADLGPALEGARALLSTSAPSAKAVAWRYRYVNEDGKRGEWKYVHSAEDCNPSEHYEREPLYAASLPETPSGISLRAVAEKIALHLEGKRHMSAADEVRFYAASLPETPAILQASIGFILRLLDDIQGNEAIGEPAWDDISDRIWQLRKMLAAAPETPAGLTPAMEKAGKEADIRYTKDSITGISRADFVYRAQIAAAPETPAIPTVPQGWKPDPEGPWVIWYEDAERPPQLYFGAGAEEAARRHYNSALTNWNVHLLAAAPDGKEGG